MPQFTPGTIGAQLHFTARIPQDAADRLAETKGDKESFGLTPDWGNVPEISVHKLRAAGAEVPAHWKNEDVVVPCIPGQAIYIGDINLAGGAVSFSMKGVNLRTGRPETVGLTDEPSQSYWASGKPLPWIDGYVPSDGQAVRQFVFLQGEIEMRADVAKHVGISDRDPYIDALRGLFYAPVVLNQPEYFLRRGGAIAFSTDYDYQPSTSYGGGLESLNLGHDVGDGDVCKVETYRSFSLDDEVETRGFDPEPVGIGAGARMAQRHEHDPHAKAGDYRQLPWFEVTFRLVWVSDWNKLARLVNAPVLDTLIDQLNRWQVEFETNTRRRLGIFQKVDTDVDAFPKVQ